MHRLISLLAGCLVLLSASAFGFDGYRKGFVIGTGVGISPYSSTQTDMDVSVLGQEVERDNAAVFSMGYLGWSWNDRDMVTGLVAINSFENESLDLSHTFYGVAWFHFYGAGGYGLFSVLGAGAAEWDTGATCPADAGFGYLVGGGYEFSPHWHVGVAVSGGRSEIGPVEITLTDVTVFFGGTLF
ncbi:hypothetical protein GF420_16165 [candidate division GN15 bacterium]|nr:hypothetical protein [candidate division GN15 bacterium]